MPKPFDKSQLRGGSTHSEDISGKTKKEFLVEYEKNLTQSGKCNCLSDNIIEDINDIMQDFNGMLYKFTRNDSQKKLFSKLEQHIKKVASNPDLVDFFG
jgi:hypothetical protein